MKQLICVCSALLIVCAALGSDLSDFRESVVAAESQEELQAVFDAAPGSISSDKSFSFYFDTTVEETLMSYDDDLYVWEDVKAWVLEDVDGRTAKESGDTNGDVSDARAVASDILSNPIYVDPQQTEDRNWVSDTGTRFSNWLEDWFNQFDVDEPDMSSSSSSLNPFGFLLGGVKFIMWAIVILAVGVVLYFVLRNFTGIGRKKRVGGLLEDDEPELTADQWLVQAEKLESEGKFREAVRCLYLACLVRYDDGGVARFRRYETNWEHLYRIEGSPSSPKTIDFRYTTQQFDKIWYGHMVKGSSDVQEFKEVYLQICQALGIQKAA